MAVIYLGSINPGFIQLTIRIRSRESAVDGIQTESLYTFRRQYRTKKKLRSLIHACAELLDRSPRVYRTEPVYLSDKGDHYFHDKATVVKL